VSPPLASSHHYTNPGFLGAYSHAAIFKQVSSQSRPVPDYARGLTTSYNAEERPQGRDPVRPQDIDTLTRLGQLDVHSLIRLLDTWTVTGANLALAQPFVQCSRVAVLSLYESLASIGAIPQDQSSHLDSLARILLANTQAQVDLNKESTIDDFVAYLGSHLRWEVVGFFFTAVGRACMEIPSYISLFKNGEQRRRLAMTLTSLSDACLDACRSLGNLSDLQLVLQYENLILLSQVDGDQSTS
jgi:hypothetical protein